MRLPSARLAISGCAALTILLCITFLTQTSSEVRAKLTRPFSKAQHSHLEAEPFVKDPHNPYTSWVLVWAKQNRTNTLVVATTKHEDVSWIADSKELQALPNLNTAIYYTDDPTAPLHTPANKGNEGMAYLTYIIDNYDNLPDVSTFLHSHEASWHVSELLNRSTVTMISRLNLEKVERDGYLNLRCDIGPGCPISVDLKRLDDGDTQSRMNKLTVDMLREVGETDLPDIIAAPCCAQFAVSRKTIQRRKKEYYIVLRDWLLNKDWPGQVSGRIYEYLWHYFFTSKAVLCPNEHQCWCDTYSICFPTEGDWQSYNDMLKTQEALRFEQDDLPENSTKRAEVQVLLDGLRAETKQREAVALELGSDPFKRTDILRAAWDRMKDRGFSE